MARGRGKPSRLGDWVQALGEQIGAELGRIIAENVQRSLERSIDVHEIARRLGEGRGRKSARGGNGRAANAAVCAEPGCGDAVLAKGLCRSHYYRARYRAQKAGTLAPRGRGRPAQTRPGKRAIKTDGAANEATIA